MRYIKIIRYILHKYLRLLLGPIKKKIKEYLDYKFLIKNGVNTSLGYVSLLGKPIIIKHTDAKIIIDKGVTLISDSKYNVAGINHPVVLGAMNRGAIIHLKNNCGLSGTSIVSMSKVEIGSYSNIGVNCNIYDTNFHPIDIMERRSNPGFDSTKVETKPIVIESDVWLGANTTVLKGVTIGRGSIIGANSLVTKNINSMEIHAGNPCKFIRKLNE